MLSSYYSDNSSEGSDTAVNVDCRAFREYGLVALLALAERLKVDLLPITWDFHRGSLGIGGQASINQALISLQTSFAFKRFIPGERDWYQAIAQEIFVLSITAIKDHPNILSLEGICWECKTYHSVRPVLVYEMSSFGDLDRFMKTDWGHKLRMEERLNLCADIGTAVRVMHANSIIHGDINPGNVLVFQEAGVYIAKVSDFGHSTYFQVEDMRVSMPMKDGWSPPEQIYEMSRSGRQSGVYGLDAAKQIDIYSYGRLCLWILSRIETDIDVPLPETHTENEHQYSDFIRRHLGHTVELQERCSKLVSLTLALRPAQRCLDFDDILSCISPPGRTPPQRKLITTVVRLPYVEHLQIVNFAPKLYQADFRVRTAVVKELSMHVADSSNPVSNHISRENATTQLAWCYQIGFGVSASSDTALELMGKVSAEFKVPRDQVEWLKDQYYNETPGSGLYKNLQDSGLIMSADLAHQYRKDGLVEEALEICQRETKDMRAVLGDHHWLVLTSYLRLSSIMAEYGKYHEAIHLQQEALEVASNDDSTSLDTLEALSIRINLAWNFQRIGSLDEAISHGVHAVEKLENATPLSIQTSQAVQGLGAAYRAAGQTDEAESLERRVLEKCQTLSPTHKVTITARNNLASTLRQQGKYKEAQVVQEEALRLMKQTLGNEHPYTLMGMGNLASIYSDQSTNISKAVGLLEECIKICDRYYSEGHPLRLISVSNLAEPYQKLGRYEEAERLTAAALTFSRERPSDNPELIKSFLNNLATIYQAQNRWSDALELQEEVVRLETSPSNFDRLRNINNLAYTYVRLGRSSEAEDQLQVALETVEGTGCKHPTFLTAKHTLALAYEHQERWSDALKTHNEIIRTAFETFGRHHSTTLIYQQSFAYDLKKVGRLDDAIKVMAKTFEMQCQAENVGPSHEDTLESKRMLDMWLREKNGIPSHSGR